MKLSEKGWSKAEKYLCPECWKDTNWEKPNEPEFESEDFKDVVILTLDEAKGLKVFVEALMKEQGTFEQWKSFDVLCKRILKAEGK